MKKIVRVLVLVLVIALIPINAFAKSSRPYKDVTKKKVGKVNYTAIVNLKKAHAYKGAFTIKKGKFKPFKKVTRKQFMRMLTNLYGKRAVPVNDGDKSKKIATVGWAKDKMIEVAVKGYGITGANWPDDGQSGLKLERYLASGYLWNFEKFFRLRGCTPIL